MAHTLAYQHTDFVGGQPIDETSTVQKHPLGLVVKAYDTTYGEGSFIYLKGVASTAVSDAVVYDVKAATTTRTTASTAGLLAIAMSANVASQYGWYQIEGEAVVNAAASIVAGKTVSQTATAGTLGPGATGVTPVYCATAKTATGTPTASFAQVQINRPWVSGFTTTVA